MSSSVAQSGLKKSTKAAGLSGSGANPGNKSRVGGVSRLSVSSRRDNAPGGGQSQSIQILFKGRDVTPQSLLTTKVQDLPASGSVTAAKPAAGRGLGDSTSGIGPEASVGRLSSGISRSGLSVSSSHGDSDDDSGFELSSAVSVEPSVDKTSASLEVDPELFAAAEVELSEAELQAQVEVTLEESDTVMLFSLPSLRVLQDTEEFARVTARNEKYAALVQLQAGGGDNFSARHTQTLNNAQKNKEISATPVTTRDAGCTAAAWDIFDSLNREDAAVGADADMDVMGHPQKPGVDGASTDPRASMSELDRAVDEAVSSSIATPGCLLDAEGSVLIAPPAFWEDPTQAGAVISRKTAKGGGNGPTGASGAGPSKSMTSSSAAGVTVGVTQSAARSQAATRKTALGGGGTSSQQQSTLDKSKVASSSSRGQGSSSTSSQTRRPSGVVIPTKPIAGDGAGDSGEGWADVKDSKDILLGRETARVLSSRSLLHSLSIVERALQQNVFHAAHRMYKAVTGVEMLESLVASNAATPAKPREAADGTAASKGRLVKLWSYNCPLAAGRPVTCMAWNGVNPDLLAVSYGALKDAARKDAPAGVVLFWSMSNPGFPQATLLARSGVTSISFSKTHTNLIAAGLQDGSVCIYDVKKAFSGEGDGYPDLTARPLDGSHTDAVWQLKWIEKSQGRGERLVSISADGKVKEWSTKKGLVCTDLMVLKRLRADGTEPAAEEKSDGVISRVDAGLCFDFPASDPNVYYTGTEDGVVHHCSVSYGEQLESFRAHSGPVYRLKISPFLPHAVLTCSADWSVKLWDMGSREQPCVFQTTDALEAVTDVCWSKTHSTRFASVTGDGRVMVWDTTSFTPLIDYRETVAVSGSLSTCKRLLSVLFAVDAPVLVTGDANGCVDVFRVVGLPAAPPTVDEQLEALMKSLHPV